MQRFGPELDERYRTLRSGRNHQAQVEVDQLQMARDTVGAVRAVQVRMTVMSMIAVEHDVPAAAEQQRDDDQQKEPCAEPAGSKHGGTLDAARRVRKPAGRRAAARSNRQVEGSQEAATLLAMSATESWIIDVDTPSFTREVVERSMQVPVLVDLWATWCEPCKTLGPVLERFANEDPGRFVLAKADVDQSPELMQAFGLTSVPAVILFVEGKPVDAFLGAKPTSEIADFLDRHLGPSGGGDGDVVAEARELFATGDFETAVMALEAEADEADGDPRAAAVLAELHFEHGDVERAQELYAALSEASLATQEGRAIGAKLALAAGAGDLAELRAAVESNPKDVAAHVALGKALVASGEHEAGLDELLEACMRDMHFDDDAPRKALLDVFVALGTADPLVVEYQQRLSVLLCS